MKKSSPFVLDCSITMTWLFSHESSKHTLMLRDSLVNTYCVVPSIWPLEVNNVLWATVKRKKISDLQVARFKYLLKKMPIRVDLKASDFLNDVIYELARQYNITCYDASYLECALREKLPLATLDSDLKKAAKAAGVPLL